MNAITAKFAQLKAAEKKGTIPYIPAGYPNTAATPEIIVALAHAGASVIEVGVPFSDPVADGPVIAEAGDVALRGGATLRGALNAVREARRTTDVPIVLFSYLNPLLRYGLGRLAADAADAGIAGVLVTDLPAQAAHGFRAELRRHGLELISLVAPTTTEERLAAIARDAGGFLYAVSRTGVTGTQETLSGEARTLVERIRQHSDLPVALGFGISNFHQAEQAWQYADAVVVGSALVRAISKAPENQAARAASDFMAAFCDS